MSLLHKVRIKLGLYDLEKECTKWVAKNFGEEYVDEFKEKYEKLNQGIPIGGLAETTIFVELIEQIKREI